MTPQTLPLLLTIDELQRGFFFREDARYDFEGGAVALSSLPFHRYNQHDSYKLVGEETDSLYSPQRGMFDLIQGDIPERSMTLDFLTPFFRTRMSYLSLEQKGVVARQKSQVNEDFALT